MPRGTAHETPRGTPPGTPLARLWLEPLAAGRHRLGDEEGHYARRVLRLRLGDPVEAFDGRGRVAPGAVAAIGRHDVELELGPPSALPPAGRRVTVALAHPKGERADWAVEKLTELGVARIWWLQAERSVVDPSAGRLERQQRVALAAVRQCGRADLPELAGPLPLAVVLAEPAAVRWLGQRGGVVPGQAPKPGSDALFVVGPEGGLSPAELSAARAAGYTEVGLGAWILRVETAAVAGAAALLDGGAAVAPAGG